MNQNTATQQLETAGRSAAAKLQAFGESLTPDERQAVALGLRLVTLTDVTTEDVAGHAIPMGLIARLAVELDLYQQWATAYQSWR